MHADINKVRRLPSHDQITTKNKRRQFQYGGRDKDKNPANRNLFVVVVGK
jgi:hypothetical protein